MIDYDHDESLMMMMMMIFVMMMNIMMHDNDVLFHYNRMVEIWGDKLPNLEQEPLRFAYYVSLYKQFHMVRL